jgi:hypothetical protein
MWPREDTDARYITSSEADNQRRCSRVGTLSGVSLFVQSDSVELGHGRACLLSKGALSRAVLCQAERRLSASRGRFIGKYIVVR